MFNLKSINCIFCIAIICFNVTSCREIKVDKSKLWASDYRIFQNTPAWKLSKAVDDNNTIKIQKIIKQNHSILDYQDSIYGKTVLMQSIYHHDYNSFEQLLKLGANVNLYDKVNGASAIIIACRYRHSNIFTGNYKTNAKFVKKLLEYGANPSDIEIGERKKGNSTRYTPLRGAAENGDIESVKLLLQYGADVNYYDEFGSCALGESLIQEHYKVVLVLLEYGADFTHSIGKYANDSLMYPIEVMRRDLFTLGSEKHREKMAVVNFIKEYYNIDYFAQPIEDYILERIKKQYPDTWQEYIEKY